MKFVTKTFSSNDLTLGMLLHYFFENRLTFDEAKASLNVGTFFWHSVYFLECYLTNSIITVFGVRFDIFMK